MSIGYKMTAVAHMEQEEQKKMWKNKIYRQKNDCDEKNCISLPNRSKKCL